MKIRNNPFFPYIQAVIAMAFWGLTFVWSKIALEVFAPVTILMLRLFISSLLLWSFILIFKKKEPVRRQDWKLFVLSALFSPFFYFIGETYGLSYVSSTLGAILISTIPVVTPLGTWLFNREKLGWINFAGFMFSFAGVLLMVSDEHTAGATSIKGVLFLVFAVIVAVASAITVKKLSNHYNSFMIVTLQNSIGLLLFIPLFFILDFHSIGTVQPDARIWRSVIALAIFGSTLAFIFFTGAIRQLGINKTSIFSNLIPVFTALFALLILNEHFSVIKIAGMIIVLGGVIIVQTMPGQKRTIVYRHVFRKRNENDL